MRHFIRRATSVFTPLPLFIGLLLLTITSCQKDGERGGAANENMETLGLKDPKSLKDFVQVNLVANSDEYNPSRIDPLLLNAWGISFSPGGTIWISSQGAGVSVVYNKDGLQQLPAVSIPSPAAATGGNPTGQVFNGGAGISATQRKSCPIHI